jgi:hypothetical protein
MRAADLTDKSEIVSLLSPAAIYRLAKPSTPPDVVTRVLEMLETGDIPTELEIVALTPRSQEADVPGLIADSGAVAYLARELHARLGDELISQLLRSRWPDLRKHLRDTIAIQPEPQAAGWSSQSPFQSSLTRRDAQTRHQGTANELRLNSKT